MMIVDNFPSGGITKPSFKEFMLNTPTEDIVDIFNSTLDNQKSIVEYKNSKYYLTFEEMQQIFLFIYFHNKDKTNFILTLEEKYSEYRHVSIPEFKEISISETELKENLEEYLDNLGFKYDVIKINSNGEEFAMIPEWMYRFFTGFPLTDEDET